MHQPAPPPDRLDSWKEIAAYLSRDERTVRRWERSEDLPVHRHVHQKQSSVYAYRSELDAWLAARNPEDAAPAETPEAIDASDSVDIPRAHNFRVIAAAATAILLIVAAIGLVMRSATPARPERIILAVLPFENLGSAEQDYFSDGLTEELITQIARLNPDRLGVLARTTVLPYKGKPQDLRALGQELSVSHVLEGTVRRDGNRARITAQLIEVENGSHVWADAFEQDIADVFSIQVDIARQVARHMAVELIPVGATALTRVPTTAPEAYQAYLRGRYEWNLRTADGLRRAIDAFQQAIALDPGYAEAYAGLAGVYSLLGFYSVAPPQEVFPRARSAAQKALDLNPALGEAWASLGFSKAFFDGDFAGAEHDFRRAMNLDANQATTYHWSAMVHAALGQFDDAIEDIEHGQRLEPLSAIINANRAFVLSAAGRFDEAIAQCQTVLQLDAQFHYAYWLLGVTYELQGKRDEALAALTKAIQLSNGNPSYRATQGFVLARAGRAREAREILHEIHQAAERTYVPPFYAALLYAGLDDRDRAFEWLDKAAGERSGSIRFLNVDRRFAHLRADPRFDELLARLSLAR